MDQSEESQEVSFYTAEPKNCDLVMKGGVTSGVAYPPAVLELAKSYQFRSIGGTSAGAIAAGVVAAAEYGRQQEIRRLDAGNIPAAERHLHANRARGFEGFKASMGQLQQEGFLVNLFQPSPTARPLFNALIAFNLWQDDKRRKGEELPKTLKGYFVAILGLLLKDNRRIAAAGALTYAVRGMLVGALAGLLLGLFVFLTLIVVTLGASPLTDRQLMLNSALLLTVFAAAGGAVGMLAGDLLGGPIAIVLSALQQLRSVLRTKAYGLCSGLTEDEHDAHAFVRSKQASVGLTNWLHQTIQDVAGKPHAEPLTFGDLGEPEDEQSWAGLMKEPATIQLRMFTTDLTMRQPFVLPRLNGIEYYFTETEMKSLFPTDVVDFMIAQGSGVDQEQHPLRWLRVTLDGKPERLYRFPSATHLPVIVAVRMSLSFPILLCAVPLWTIRDMTYRELCDAADRRIAGGADPSSVYGDLLAGQIERHWLSDGGICSNFPIHFFDKWFPDSPTFGINLADADPHRDGDDLVVALEKPHLTLDELLRHYGTAVNLPNVKESPSPRRYEIGDVFSFLWSILQTSLSYRDALQSRLPSYRERIVDISLIRSEGGLNLAMSPQTIATIAQKGMLAGMLLRERFSMEHHQWIRMRLLIEELNEQMQVLKTDLVDTDLMPPDWAVVQLELQKALVLLQPSNTKVRQLLEAEAAAQDPFPFFRQSRGSREDTGRLYLLLLLIAVWGDTGQPEFFGGRKFSRSHVALRVTPDM